jgi:16S rRNA (guanine1516-N2)-methyltransferase
MAIKLACLESGFSGSDVLELEKVNTVPDQGESYFLFDEAGLSLVDAEFGKLHLDFINDQKNYARKAHRGKSELIAKALGLQKKGSLIVDATLGLAQDAWFLSQIGARVIGFERSPHVFLLLEDALRRARQAGSDAQLEIHFANSLNAIESMAEKPMAVYLDPMFPEKKKTALPRKEMRIFKKWVGEDEDAGLLLKSSLQCGAERIVVKRPLKAEPLLPGVVHRFTGTTVRYDLYSPRS